MSKLTLILIALMSMSFAFSGTPGRLSQDKQVAPKSSPNVKISIASVGSFLGPPTSRYKVGEQIPIAITMTNTTADSFYACISSDLFQNLPRLTKDGKEVPYMQCQSYQRIQSQNNNTCKEENLPEPVLLKPNEPTLADWFVLVDDSRSATGAEAWYEQLTPGKYELSLQRRLNCCDGPMFESNKITFEVVP